MATIKSYTDIDQSKKLAEIFPLESADMVLWGKDFKSVYADIHAQEFMKGLECRKMNYVPCWSLAALLGVLPLVDFKTPQLIGTPKTLYRCMYNDVLKSHAYDNPVDACYKLVLKLHELKML